MNHLPLIFLGVFATLASSFWGLILMPQLKLGQQDMIALAGSGELYPAARPGKAQAGLDVYQHLGCAECHTLQVRPRQFGSDFRRGWGLRYTVAQDYLRDYPVLLGNLRLGPDLANIGARQTNAVWHYYHLFDPRSTSPGSLMPKYPFLFNQVKVAAGAQPPHEALPPLNNQPGAAWLVPTEEGRALVAYLLSLRATVSLFEAPLPAQPTNQVAAGGAALLGGAGVPGPTNVGSLNTNPVAGDATTPRTESTPTNVPAAPAAPGKQ